MEINSKKFDELYKEWSGEHHTINSNKPVHDSAECCDFAEYCLKYGKEEHKVKANTKDSVLPIFSVIWRVLYHIPLIGMFLPSTSWFLQHNRWFITWHLCTSLLFYVGGLILWLTQHAT